MTVGSRIHKLRLPCQQVCLPPFLLCQERENDTWYAQTEERDDIIIVGTVRSPLNVVRSFL